MTPASASTPDFQSLPAWAPLWSTDGRAGDGTRAPGRYLDGLKVLVLEDDFFVGLDLSHMLEDLGGSVVGPFRTLERAESAVAAGGFDLAILDVNIAGRYSFGIAEDLGAKKIPVLFVTAYAGDDKLFPPSTQSIPRVAKPVQPQTLLQGLRRVI
jgi:CheY-like chemotaxis protein